MKSKIKSIDKEEQDLAILRELQSKKEAEMNEEGVKYIESLQKFYENMCKLIDIASQIPEAYQMAKEKITEVISDPDFGELKMIDDKLKSQYGDIIEKFKLKYAECERKMAPTKFGVPQDVYEAAVKSVAMKYPNEF